MLLYEQRLGASCNKLGEVIMILESILLASAVLSVYNNIKNTNPEKPVILNYINNANNNADHITHQQNGIDSTLGSEFLNLTDDAQNIFYSITNKIKAHPFKTLVTIITATSAWIYYVIYTCNNLISNSESWCNWEYDISLDQSAIIKLLKQKISNKYIILQSHNANHDFSKLFLHDICEELKQLDNYMYWHVKLTQAGLQTLFPLPHNPKLIDAKKRQLQQILKIFTQEIAKKNILK